MPLPALTPEQVRRTRAVQKEIDRMTAGERGFVNKSDSDLKSLRAIAEENLRTKKK